MAAATGAAIPAARDDPQRAETMTDPKRRLSDLERKLKPEDDSEPMVIWALPEGEEPPADGIPGPDFEIIQVERVLDFRKKKP